MQTDLFRNTSPGLLVSVRSASEAIAALAGGADVIDVKEPLRGSLGAADFNVMQEVVRAVNLRRPITAALGELLELENLLCMINQPAIPHGVLAFKIGLAGCGNRGDWRSAWGDAIHRLVCKQQGSGPYPVAVAYADWHAAHAPKPSDVLRAARESECPALLVDTWDKSSGSLFEHWPLDELREFSERAHRFGIGVVYAGSLRESDVPTALCAAPGLVAVRTAACEGGRNGSVSAARVRKLKQSIADAANEPGDIPQSANPETAVYRPVKA